MKAVGSDQNEKLREAASFGDAHAVRVLLKVKNQSQYKLSHFVKVPFCQVPSLQSLKTCTFKFKPNKANNFNRGFIPA